MIEKPGNEKRWSENRRQTGTLGEEYALQYLLSKGYSLKEKNYRVVRGELDLIVEDPKGVLVFVEVKAGKSNFSGPPAAKVNRQKISVLQRIAQRYVAENRFEKREMRFDVIAIRLPDTHTNQTPIPYSESMHSQIDHLENAFIPDGDGYYPRYPV